jgi:D-amino-acid dehydrogenase
MAANYDVIVVGGGIAGASVAYHAVRAGAKTLLVDRHDEGRATDAAAGVLSSEISRRTTDSWFHFAVKAVAYYPQLVEELSEAAAGETSYARCGMLLVAPTEADLPAFAEAEAEMLARRDALGIPAADDLYPIAPEEAQELFPPLANVVGALYYRNAARVDGKLLARALRQGAEQHGLHLLDGDVEQLLREGARVTGVKVMGDSVGAGSVVIAGGAWSKRFGEQLDIAIPVEPQRGQIVHLELPGANTGEWPIVSALGNHYLVGWPDQRVAAGATRETGSGYAPVTTAAGMHEVLEEALRVAPGLAMARIKEVRVGLRPLPPDGLPVLGAVPGLSGVLLATGHGSTGLQLGPYSGKLVAGLAWGDAQPTDELAAFSIARFGGACAA